MSRKKKIITCVLILLIICVLVISAFTFFHIPMSITESNLFKVFVKQTEESETAMLQRKTDDVKEESLDEISESNVQSSSDKTEEQPETEEYSTIPEGASDVSDLPLTEEPVKLSDIYAEKGSDVVFRCFDKDAQSYEWEYYDLSKRMWTAAPVDKILSQKDELHRMVSCFKVKAKEENHEMMLRCIIHYENREDDVQTASLYVLRKSIKEIKVDDVVTDANSYMDAIKLPVCVIYEDRSTDTIIGLNNLYFLVTEEQIDYSTSISGNRIETVTTTHTECNYCQIALEEKETILRYHPSNLNTVIETKCKVSGQDIQAPIISAINISPYEVSSVDRAVTLTINIEAEDNLTPYPYLEYAFVLSGTKLSENDWMRKASFDAEITRNGTYIAYVRDQSGNISKMEKEIVTVDTKAPAILDVTLSNTQGWCKSNTIMVTAEDFSDMEYRFICKADGTDSDWITYSEYSAGKNGTWIIQVRDKAGNQSEREIVINNIDQEAPIIRSITIKK